jgi:acyl-CoA dehydrogenase
MRTARHLLRGVQPTETPSEHIPTRREAAREKFADALDALAVQS